MNLSPPIFYAQFFERILNINMGKVILDLTRKVLPKLSTNSKQNIANINSMPEMVLSRMIRDGNKEIVHVDMNKCVAALINENKVNTIYTDALCGCNSVGLVTKTLEGKPLAILSHYVPTAVESQVTAFEKQLQTYAYYTDKTYKPRLFFNIRGVDFDGKLEPVQNPIVEKMKNLIAKYFSQGAEVSITAYPTKNRGAFFSSANIFQFNPSNLNEMKVTCVGEKEKFLDLNM